MNTKVVNIKGTKDQSHMIILTDTEKVLVRLTIPA